MIFSEEDIKQIKQKGLSISKINEQVQLFKNGIPFANLIESATINNGILSISETEKQDYINLFDACRNDISILKFVPASGAATRMFKTLYNFIEEFKPENETIRAFIDRKKSTDLSVFFERIEKFPFYDAVLNKVTYFNPNYETLTNDNKALLFVKTMLDENILNFGNYPKGLLPFHKYKDRVATAFEEHLFEAASYASGNNKAYIHFTISEKHKELFNKEFERIQNRVEQKTKTRFHISFSFQKESTDTISVTLENQPLRDEHHKLVFRPAGHGALLENLNHQNADIIFIKNIDNVLIYKYINEISNYKKMLAGILLQIQQQAFQYSKQLENTTITEEELATIAAFLSQQMNVKIASEYNTFTTNDKIAYLKEKLNRPIRVCGMVKSDDDPGGGPFWVKHQNGHISLQIVESAQIDKNSEQQQKVLKNTTHFNPADIVCGIKNYKGEKFDLKDFVDPKAAFITIKTIEGKAIKALELPGLWNGSMAHWNTIFVETPIITFSPVKSATDLINATHQVS